VDPATSTRNQPHLDEETFQRILAAAYALQKYEVSQRASTLASNYPQTVSSQSGMLPKIASGAKQADTGAIDRLTEIDRTDTEEAGPVTKQPEAISANQPHGQRALAEHLHAMDELFWNAAAVAGVAAILALSFVAAAHRSSPLPAHLSRAPEGATQAAPFQRTELGGSPAPNPATSTIRDAKPPGASSQATPVAAPGLSAQKTITKAELRHRHYSPEADIVAKDTVVYYKAGSAVPSATKP